MSKITVYTFFHPRPGKTVRLSHIHAYTRWCPLTWSGRKAYEVEAINGDDAKRIAKQLRYLDELSAYGNTKEMRP